MKHPMERIHADALHQLTDGKGNARHGVSADGGALEFLSQDWKAIAQAHGAGFLTGQAEKKLRESNRLPSELRRKERLGAMNYIGMAVIFEDLTPPPKGTTAHDEYMSACKDVKASLQELAAVWDETKSPVYKSPEDFFRERIAQLEGQLIIAIESLTQIRNGANLSADDLRHEALCALESIPGFTTESARQVAKESAGDLVLILENKSGKFWRGAKEAPLALMGRPGVLNHEGFSLDRFEAAVLRRADAERVLELARIPRDSVLIVDSDFLGKSA